MSHEKWDDEKIEKILSDAPKVPDHRSKEDVLSRLKNEGVFDEQPAEKKKRKKFHWTPFIVSAAAIVLLAIFIPIVMNQANDEEMVSQESSNISNDRAIEVETKNSLINSMDATMMVSNSLKTAVYPDELEGNTVFQLGLASDAADSVPVTVLIPNEKLQEDFTGEMPTGVDLYNKYAPVFNEETIGFVEYHPYVGSISEQGEQILHTLPKDQPYDIASASLETYKASIIDTFQYYYEEAVFLNEDGSVFEFSEVGEPSKPLPLNHPYNYFKHTQANGSAYLVPNFRATYDTVQAALEAMKEETNDIYQSVIPSTVDYEVVLENQVVTVTFAEELDLLGMDGVAAMQMIEGILLTAANFNVQVQIHNIMQQQWEGFDFTSPLPMPVAPNKVAYSTVFE